MYFLSKYVYVCAINYKNTFGENKQARVTLADKLIVTDIDVILNGT